MESKELKVSDPIVIRITNKSTRKKPFNIFGFNKFSGLDNFGNDKDVEIKCLDISDYNQFFNNTSSSSFWIGLVRVQSNTQSNINGVLMHHSFNLINNTCTIREIDVSVMRNAFQHQTDIVDFRWKKLIGKNNHISGSISANSYVTISIFPYLKASLCIDGKPISQTCPVTIQPCKPIKLKKEVSVKKNKK